ncbi:MAG TPA: bifunctional phosphoribosyl-AMP cyclohydrolase/phosphoribosyl-ATP diphosphatase HisIE [Polyangiaceae bacterium]|nr:bifunctional phosphoribosyl-AMP cyclohydrolase/phosphoribosyl-ATP diphosphatase HisIE [Polyangiaceae bacterium]
MPNPDITFDSNGLVTAIAQDRATGEVRMVAWMNAAALEQTLATGLATFYSRSRQKLWVKGETSGHRLRVASVMADCDADTLLLLVDPEGASCHTGRPTCFFRRVTAAGLGEPERQALPYLFELEETIAERAAATAAKSYTKSLLDGGAAKINQKIEEEAGEVARAIAGESDERVASEAADVLYHLLVGLRLRQVPFRAVVEKLIERSAQSGHAEKAARKPV